LPKKSFIFGFIISSFKTILNKFIAFSLTSLLLLYNIIKVGTIKAIFAIIKVKAKAIKGIALGVISIRLFSPRTY
jgi:hypothetical protein